MQTDVHVRLAFLRTRPRPTFLKLHILAAQVERSTDARAGIKEIGKQGAKLAVKFIGGEDDAERIFRHQPISDDAAFETLGPPDGDVNASVVQDRRNRR